MPIAAEVPFPLEGLHWGIIAAAPKQELKITELFHTTPVNESIRSSTNTIFYTQHCKESAKDIHNIFFWNIDFLQWSILEMLAR